MNQAKALLKYLNKSIGKIIKLKQIEIKNHLKNVNTKNREKKWKKERKNRLPNKD